jgi:hypothetical protein
LRFNILCGIHIPVFDSCKRIKLWEPLKTGNSRVFCFLKK